MKTAKQVLNECIPDVIEGHKELYGDDEELFNHLLLRKDHVIKAMEEYGNIRFNEGKKDGINETSNCYRVMHAYGEDWEQLSVAFSSMDEAKKYFDRVNKDKYPYPIIMIELKGELLSKL